jgi:hypothetical protein
MKPVTDPIVINGQVLTKGTELVIYGRRGRYRYIDASLTSEGKTVLNLVGPVGYKERFSAVYLEKVKNIYGRKGKR